MSVQGVPESMFKFGDPYLDETQDEYVWGILDPPDPIKRDDDQFYEVVQGDRFDLIAHRLLGNHRYWWVILHYNNIADFMAVESYVGKLLRLPSRQTLQRVYTNAVE